MFHQKCLNLKPAVGNRRGNIKWTTDNIFTLMLFFFVSVETQNNLLHKKIKKGFLERKMLFSNLDLKYL